MRFLKMMIAAVLAGSCGLAMAGETYNSGPQLGLYMTKFFGGDKAVPMHYGMRFDLHQTGHQLGSYQYAPQYTPSERPALFDLQFSSQGVRDFRAAGVSVLEPGYFLSVGEGGLFSSINWKLVGFVAVGGGLLIAGSEDSDDRLDRIARIEENNPFTGSDDDDGDTTEDEDPILGCDPVLGQCL